MTAVPPTTLTTGASLQQQETVPVREQQSSNLVEDLERAMSFAAPEHLTRQLERLSIGAPGSSGSSSSPASSCGPDTSSSSSSSSSSRGRKFRSSGSRPSKPECRGSCIRKKTAQPGMRPRALSCGTVQMLQGNFGPVCRKMFAFRRRRSLSSDDEPSKTAPTPTPSAPPAGSGSSPPVVGKACGQEASSPDFEVVAGDVEELAEYFNHFVTVRLKMSPLAESMYV